MARHQNGGEEFSACDDYDIEWDRELNWGKPNRQHRKSREQRRGNRRERGRAHRQRARVEASDGAFRCKQCKTMVGAPLWGGRHRNHCPLCLYSRHVDDRHPGDRKSECLSLMKAVGVFNRRNGEQVLVHECLGCGVVRQNRVAADDNTIETMRLPVLSTAGDGSSGEGATERTA